MTLDLMFERPRHVRGIILPFLATFAFVLLLSDINPNSNTSGRYLRNLELTDYEPRASRQIQMMMYTVMDERNDSNNQTILQPTTQSNYASQTIDEKNMGAPKEINRIENSIQTSNEAQLINTFPSQSEERMPIPLDEPKTSNRNFEENQKTMASPPETRANVESQEKKVNFGEQGRIQEVEHNSNSMQNPSPNPNSVRFDESKHAIVALVDNDERSLTGFCFTIESMNNNNIAKRKTPIIVFHDMMLTAEKREMIKGCAINNDLSFHLAPFTFPDGFNSEEEYNISPLVANQGTNKYNRPIWGYAHVVRFWTTWVWKHPAIKDLKTVMRIDTDSCFTNVENDDDVDTQYLPGMMGRYVYRIETVRTGNSNFIDGLYDFAVAYMEREGIKPQNPALWESIKSTWEDEKALPIFIKNVEIARVAFFRRNDVMKWHDALTEQEPFGVFRHRWSDAQTRVLTMAMFAAPLAVLMKKEPGYTHGFVKCQEAREKISKGFKDAQSTELVNSNMQQLRPDQQQAQPMYSNMEQPQETQMTRPMVPGDYAQSAQPVNTNAQFQNDQQQAQPMDSNMMQPQETQMTHPMAPELSEQPVNSNLQFLPPDQQQMQHMYSNMEQPTMVPRDNVYSEQPVNANIQLQTEQQQAQPMYSNMEQTQETQMTRPMVPGDYAQPAQPVNSNIQFQTDQQEGQPMDSNMMQPQETQLTRPMAPEDLDWGSYAIVALVEADERAVEDFCLALHSFDKNFILIGLTPILVFHEDDLSEESKATIKNCSTNPISLHLIELSFPKGFEAELEQEEYLRVAKQGTKKFSRKLWSYSHLIRFWTTTLWKHPAISNYQTVMRVDIDSCFVQPSDDRDVEDQNLPGIRGRYVYRINDVGTGVNTWVEGLYNFALRYMEREGIEPQNPALWSQIRSTWENEHTLPVFFKNFEVNRVSFFQQPEVMKWHEALTEQEPFGVYRHRWSDANTRVFTMAMFAKPEMVLMKKHPGYRHGKGVCDDYYNNLEWKRN